MSLWIGFSNVECEMSNAVPNLTDVDCSAVCCFGVCLVNRIDVPGETALLQLRIPASLPRCSSIVHQSSTSAAVTVS